MTELNTQQETLTISEESPVVLEQEIELLLERVARLRRRLSQLATGSYKQAGLSDEHEANPPIQRHTFETQQLDVFPAVQQLF